MKWAQSVLIDQLLQVAMSLQHSSSTDPNPALSKLLILKVYYEVLGRNFNQNRKIFID